MLVDRFCFQHACHALPDQDNGAPKVGVSLRGPWGRLGHTGGLYGGVSWGGLSRPSSKMPGELPNGGINRSRHCQGHGIPRQALF